MIRSELELNWSSISITRILLGWCIIGREVPIEFVPARTGDNPTRTNLLPPLLRARLSDSQMRYERYPMYTQANTPDRQLGYQDRTSTIYVYNGTLVPKPTHTHTHRLLTQDLPTPHWAPRSRLEPDLAVLRDRLEG